jgi:hypothetical protein
MLFDICKAALFVRPCIGDTDLNGGVRGIARNAHIACPGGLVEAVNLNR